MQKLHNKLINTLSLSLTWQLGPTLCHADIIPQDTHFSHSLSHLDCLNDRWAPTNATSLSTPSLSFNDTRAQEGPAAATSAARVAGCSHSHPGPAPPRGRGPPLPPGPGRGPGPLANPNLTQFSPEF